MGPQYRSGQAGWRLAFSWPSHGPDPRLHEADIEELAELLPSYIEYHRSAKWLPDPHRRTDN
jgi:hypothetical protein